MQSTFDGSVIEDTFLRPCICQDEEKNTTKSFCFVEGTILDKDTSENIEDLSENVWYETKPPKLFNKDITPLVSARQILIARIMLSGTRNQMESEEEEPPKEKAKASIGKKKSAVRFLSTTKTNMED